MLQHVNTVLVTNTDLKTSYLTTDNVGNIPLGEIFMETQEGKIVNEGGDLTGATAVRFGLKTSETFTGMAYPGVTTPSGNVIKYTPFIQKGAVKQAIFTEYEAPVEEVIVFDLSAATISGGKRYVVRFIFNDIYEHPGQFTKTYEVIARTTSINDLLQEIKARISKDLGKRIDVKTTTAADTTNATDATASTVKLVATAKVKNDNEGAESINTYSQISMEGFMYFTSPSATGWDSKIKSPVASATITKTVGKYGKGFWKLVRDREQAALAYAGYAYRNIWPYSNMKHAITATSPAYEYDSFVIEFENKFLTPDNQKNANTMQSVELYYKNTGVTATKSIVTYFNTFNA